MSVYSASRQTPAAAVFVILTPAGQPLEGDWEKLRSSLRPNHTLRILPVTDPRLDACVVTSSYISRACYMRFLLPDVLPEAERCLYLDGDVMLMDDLSRLWAECDPSAPVSAARDLKLAVEGGHMKSLGLTSYFNSGVMGLNLQVWRAGGYTDVCFRLAASGDSRFQHQDQDVLNLVFAGRVAWLDPRWNILSDFTGIYVHDSNLVSKTEWRRMRAQPGIVHFCGPAKPWHGTMGNYWAWHFWKMAASSPWRAEYAPRRATAHRKYIRQRMRYWRRWCFRFAMRRNRPNRFFILFGRRFNLS